VTRRLPPAALAVLTGAGLRVALHDADDPPARAELLASR
jgi:hypothetical protein